ncbi:MAG TPA: basic amino acid ABC transporter substrate-binding protein [Actinophytocola sp.]|nr:basic amino acid ABC transporter substrate-binding protein [Actinophytocola sp.]
MTRRPTRKVWALVPALALVLAGCGGDDGGDTAGGDGGVQLVAEGKLTNCTGLPYKPFEYQEGDEIVGFDIDLVDLVAEELGVEQTVVDTPFDGIQSGADFAARKCDLASAGMTITEERKKAIDFSDPYFEATQALVAKKGSGLTDLASLSGKRLGVQNRTTGQEYAQENAQGAELVVFEDLGLLLAAVESGQVQAAINDNGVLYDWIKDKPDFEVVTEFDTGEQYGIGVRKGNTALLDVINRVLAEAKESGEYDRIYEKWFGTKPEAN